MRRAETAAYKGVREDFEHRLIWQQRPLTPPGQVGAEVFQARKNLNEDKSLAPDTASPIRYYLATYSNLDRP